MRLSGIEITIGGLLLLLQISCGVRRGTEIGNGLKPKDKSNEFLSPDKKPQQEERGKGAPETRDNSIGDIASNGTPAKPKDSSNEEASASPEGVDKSKIKSEANADGGARKIRFEVELLLAPCLKIVPLLSEIRYRQSVPQSQGYHWFEYNKVTKKLTASANRVFEIKDNDYIPRQIKKSNCEFIKEEDSQNSDTNSTEQKTQFLIHLEASSYEINWYRPLNPTTKQPEAIGKIEVIGLPDRNSWIYTTQK